MGTVTSFVCSSFLLKLFLEIQGFAGAYHFGNLGFCGGLSFWKGNREEYSFREEIPAGFLKGVPYGWIRFWLVNCMVPEGGRISIGPGAAGICMV